MTIVGVGSLTPLRVNSGSNFGRMYVSRKIVTPTASTAMTPG